MLQNLEITNGELSPKFDSYTNIYSVNVASDVTSLSINYIAEEGYTVNIYGNTDFSSGENIVTLEVIGETKNTYTLLVNKEEVETVSNFELTYQPLEVKKEVPGYIAPLISICCFLIILFTYTLLFHKKKHK